jgi:hypothetical protein
LNTVRGRVTIFRREDQVLRVVGLTVLVFSVRWAMRADYATD